MGSMGTISDREKWRAVIASLALPGLGQVYNGELIKGGCLFALFVMTPLVGFWLTTRLPDPLLMGGSGCTAAIMLSIYSLAVAEAGKAAAAHGTGYMLRSYNRSYFYITVWLFCSLVVAPGVLGYTQEHMLQLIRIAGGSMEPTVLRGDRVIVDRTAYGRMAPKRHDIIIFRYPNDRSRLYIKRVEGLPGDVLRLDDGRQVAVPPGHVFVLGDDRGHSEDSRHYGALPLSEALGKARQIYFSRGEGGMRWGRIGQVLP